MIDPNATGLRLDVESTAEQVTFFEDRAEVKRRARAELPSGVSMVRIAGVSVAIDDTSVGVGVRGGSGRTLSARVTRQVRRETAAGAEEIAALEADVDQARKRVAQVELGIARAESELARGDELVEGWESAVVRVPRDGPTSVAAARLAHAQLDQAQAKAMEVWAQRRLELHRARMQVEQLCLKLSQARALVPRHEAVIEAQIEMSAANAADLEITYRVPCALWRPEHLAHLEQADGKVQVILRTWATVWQRTGEAWTGVACRFSTARPARAASAPLITDDVVTARRKSVEERKTVVIEARDQAIAVAGLDRGTRDVDEMPGVDDGGEPLTFSSAGPATIPSDGQPFRIELQTVTLPATVDTVSYPERTSAVHIRATLTLAHRSPLLAGPVWIARGSELVGRSKLPFVAAGEPFELGFGTDDGVRVRRRVDETRDTVPVIGTQRITRKVNVFLSNLSGSARKLTVTERIPVSEIADLRIELVSADGSRAEKKDGFVRFDLEVPARGTRELALSYRIEAAAKVRLPF